MRKYLIAVLLVVFHVATVLAQVADDALVAYYPFNGNANDETPNHNDGAVSSAMLTSDRFGTPNSAYLFDGSSEIVVPDSPSLRIPGDITISCWFKLTETNLNVRFVGKGGECGRNYGLWGNTKTNFSLLFQQSSPEGGCNGCMENTTVTIPTNRLGTWHQITAVRDGGFAYIYMDGLSVTRFDAFPVCSPTTYTGSEPLTIGSPGFSGADKMIGGLDEVRIFNRVLTEPEIKTLYNIDSHLHPWATVKLKTVEVTMHVVPGRKYQVQSFQLQPSVGMWTWTNVGDAFVADAPEVPMEYDLSEFGQFYRLQQVP